MRFAMRADFVGRGTVVAPHLGAVSGVYSASRITALSTSYAARSSIAQDGLARKLLNQQLTIIGRGDRI